MKKFALAFSAALFCALSFAQTKTLKIATIAPSRSVWDVEERRLAQEWARRTGNQVQMQFMSANAMGGEAGAIQKLNSVRPGQRAPIDGALFTSIGLASLVPETHFLTLALPFMFQDQDEIDYVLAELSPRFQNAASKKGYMILGCFNVGWAYFYTKKPARSPAELKAQRLSVAGVGTPELTNAFKAAGFNTSDVPAEKLLQSMRTPGGVEGFYTIPLYAYAGQYYKSLQYILDVPVFPVMAAFIMSEKSWSEIPDKFKADLLKAVKDAEKNFIESQRASDKEYLGRCVEGGCELVELTGEERKVMEDTLKDDAKAMINTGLFDQALYDDTMALLKKYRDSHK